MAVGVHVRTSGTTFVEAADGWVGGGGGGGVLTLAERNKAPAPPLRMNEVTPGDSVCTRSLAWSEEGCRIN